MKTLIITLIGICRFLLPFRATLAIDCYRGSEPPPIEIIQLQLSIYERAIKVVGLRKECDGSYIVVTDKNTNQLGCSYRLFKLRSNKWVMTGPGKPVMDYDSFAEITLKNAATAQEAFFVDNQTYADSIEKLIGGNYSLPILNGVKLQVDYADKERYSMRAFHIKGRKIFFIRGPGGGVTFRNMF